MRRLVIIVGCLLGGVLSALFLLPWWLGPALTAIGSSRGLSFSAYERIGYSRFALRDVVVVRPPVRVTIKCVEADTPVLWLWRHWTHASRIVTATSWDVTVLPKQAIAGAGSAPSSAWGAMRLRRKLFELAAQLDRWLPRAEVGPGAVRWPGDGLGFGAATWGKRTLTVKALSRGAQTADVRLAFSSTGELRADATDSGKNWQLFLNNRDADVTGEMRVWGQVAPVSGHFAEQGWLPAEAQVRAQGWQVPAEQLKWGELYATVRGDARVEWREGKFETALEAKGEPLPKRGAPPLEATLRGHGDAQSLTVESLDVALPGIVAHLSSPIVFDRKGKLLSGTSRFAFDADLAKQPWLTARGRVTGEARLTPRAGSAPQVEIALEGQEIAVDEFIASHLAATATLDWPRLEVKTAKLDWDERHSIAARGTWNFATHELRQATLEGTMKRVLLSRWLPKTVGFETLTVAVKAEGPLTALQHEGSAATGIGCFRPAASADTQNALGKESGSRPRLPKGWRRREHRGSNSPERWRRRAHG